MTIKTVPDLICLNTFKTSEIVSPRNSTRVNAVVISPDQTRIAVVGTHNRNHSEKWMFVLIDLSTGQDQDMASRVGWRTHQAEVNSACFTPDGHFIVVGSLDQTSQYHDYPSLSLWDMNEIPAKITETPKYTTQAPKDGVIFIVACHPEKQRFATIDGKGIICLWQFGQDRNSNATLISTDWYWQAHRSASHAMIFSPDGRWLCSGSTNGEMKLWDSETGELLRTFAKHDHSVRSLAFSSDGSTLVSGSDQRIKIWDTATGELRRSFFGHADWVRGLAITPDSQFLISAGSPKIKIWDLATGQKLNVIKAHDAAIRSIALSEDGSLLVTGSSDGVVKVWQLQ